MARQIKIFDTTLRDGEQMAGVNLNTQEKTEVAKSLEKLGADYIEAGFAISSDGDFESINEISKAVKNSHIVSLARCDKHDIDRAYEALRPAVAPRIHVFIATSDIHLQYKLHMTREQVLAKVRDSVKYAKSLMYDIQFSAEDATRTDIDFLFKVYEEAIKSGATCINIPDTVGYSEPAGFGRLIARAKAEIPGADNVDIAVHCHNDLGLAVANSAAAVMSGATQIECTCNGIGERAGNASLEELVMLFNTRRDYFDVNCRIDTTKISRTSRLISSVTGVFVPVNKPIVGANAFAHESGIHQHGVLNNALTYEIMTPKSIGLSDNRIVLGKHSGKHAFAQRLSELGIAVDEEHLKESFERFKQLADRKKEITDDDLYAIVDDKSRDKGKKYELVRYQITTGNQVINTTTLELKEDGVVKTCASTGEGPIDSCYNAINEITGRDIKLTDYNIRAVTGGRDAIGEVSVRIKCDDKIYMGRGISTDIIESSILAYLSAVNKI